MLPYSEVLLAAPPDFSAPRTPKAHLWFSGSVGQGNLPTAAKVVQLGWEFSLVIYPGSTPVGNATLVVAKVLTCNKYSQKLGRCCFWIWNHFKVHACPAAPAPQP
jgi:hypothetical protein